MQSSRQRSMVLTARESAGGSRHVGTGPVSVSTDEAVLLYSDWGDPLEEFFKLPKYTLPISPSFARGQVDGYWGVEVPVSFWAWYNLYVALNQHASQLGGYAADQVAFTQEGHAGL